jgi:hypothetical protein
MVTLICAAVLIGRPRKLDRALFLGLPTLVSIMDIMACSISIFARLSSAALLIT